MKLKNENGYVTFIMRAGLDLVKSQMPISTAQSILDKGKNIMVQGEDVSVDDKYFFQLEPENKPRKKRAKK